MLKQVLQLCSKNHHNDVIIFASNNKNDQPYYSTGSTVKYYPKIKNLFNGK
ncbi:hypothetical protein SAMN05444267_10436 [Chryseobacterium polytrichastri]|uniref:Uncharacterized protein n=1 Tax=Chryseobacterium polytrichastri TaxID=1302687 RepID=A0A1M7HZ53_9FLAO|nr:hypothetical protein SAMN05444267_10436 [Chryseobacterium polytrichastri]